jgi:hypothetical protein
VGPRKMAGETDLHKLLQDMSPTLNPGEYVFCAVQAQEIPADWEPLGWFREKEARTVILPRSRADALGLSYSFVSAWITLNVHSALEAVGLTAAVSQALSQAGISCNVVAGYHHDHLFVPARGARRALEMLEALARSNQQTP